MAKLTNMINSSVVIEDLGIILNTKESKLVDIDIASRSKDLTNKIKEKLITKQIVNHPAIHIWPFHTNSVQKVQEPVQPEVKKSERPENDELRDQVRTLTNRLDSLIDILSVKQEPTIVNNYIGQDSQSIQTSKVKPNETMFIPSKIVPDKSSEEIRLTSKNEEAVSEGFDSTRDALRAARKKSKM
jgi:hypothetical protein